MTEKVWKILQQLIQIEEYNKKFYENRYKSQIKK